MCERREEGGAEEEAGLVAVGGVLHAQQEQGPGDLIKREKGGEEGGDGEEHYGS